METIETFKDLMSVKHQDVMFGTCAGLAGIATGAKSSVCFIGGADSTIKTFDLATRDLVDDFVVEVLGEEVELSVLKVYQPVSSTEEEASKKGYLFFGTVSGVVSVLPFDDSEGNLKNIKFENNDVTVVFRSTQPIRDLAFCPGTTKGTMAEMVPLLAVATSEAAVKIISLAQLNKGDFGHILSVDLPAATGPVKQVAFAHLTTEKRYLITASCDSALRVWNLAKLDFEARDSVKMAHITQNVFSTDKQKDIEQSKRYEVAICPSQKYAAVAGDRKLRIYSTDSWQLSYHLGEGVFSAATNCVQFSPNGNYVFATSLNKEFAAFSLGTRETVWTTMTPEPCQRLEFSQSLAAAVLLSDSGDFWILDKLQAEGSKTLIDALPTASAAPAQSDSLAPLAKPVVETESDIIIGQNPQEPDIDLLGARRLEIRDELNTTKVSEAEISEVVAKVLAAQAAARAEEEAEDPVAVARVVQPNSTMRQGPFSTACFLDWNESGKIIRSDSKVEVHFADMSRKHISIDAYEVGRMYSLGRLAENALLLCTQVSRSETSMTASPQPAPFHKFTQDANRAALSRTAEPRGAETSILQQAFEQAHQQETSFDIENTEQAEESQVQSKSGIFFKRLSRASAGLDSYKDSEWFLELDHEESILLCCAGEDFVCVVTDELFLRIIRHSSLQEHPIRLQKLPKTVIAKEQQLFIVYNDPESSYEWFEVGKEGTGNVLTLVSAGTLPFQSTSLVWAGFSDALLPCYMEEQGNVYALSSKTAYNWVLLHEPTTEVALWPIAIQQGCLLALRLKNRDTFMPSVHDNPVVEKIDLNINIIGYHPKQKEKVGSLKYRIEEKTLKTRLLYDTEKLAAIDNLLFKHLMLSTKLEKYERILGLLRGIQSSPTLEKARAYLSKHVDNQQLLEAVDTIIHAKQQPKTRPSLSMAQELPRSTLSQHAMHTQDLSFTPLDRHRSSEEAKTADEVAEAERETHVTPKLARTSTFSKEARQSSLKKQRIF